MQPFNMIISVVGIICVTSVVLTLLKILSTHLAHRRMSSSTASSDEILLRLERIEQIVDTTAIEIERLSESNRFVTKLLAEKSEAILR